jgi:predicted DNA-binding transcriptional regulator AlpA
MNCRLSSLCCLPFSACSDDKTDNKTDNTDRVRIWVPTALLIGCLIALDTFYRTERARESRVAHRDGSKPKITGPIPTNNPVLAESDNSTKLEETRLRRRLTANHYGEAKMSASPAFRVLTSDGVPDILEQLSRSERLLTARELASILAISPKTIYSYAERNMIPHFKIEANVRFRGRDVADWLRSHASVRREPSGLRRT